MPIFIDKDRCPKSHRCHAAQACPTGALKQKGYGAPELDEEKCIECGRCVGCCAMNVIREV